MSVLYPLRADESSPVGPDLRERQGPGEAHADAGPRREDHRLRGPEPPLAEGDAEPPPVVTLLMSVVKLVAPLAEALWLNPNWVMTLISLFTTLD